MATNDHQKAGEDIFEISRILPSVYSPVRQQTAPSSQSEEGKMTKPGLMDPGNRNSIPEPKRRHVHRPRPSHPGFHKAVCTADRCLRGRARGCPLPNTGQRRTPSNVYQSQIAQIQTQFGDVLVLVTNHWDRYNRTDTFHIVNLPLQDLGGLTLAEHT